MSEENICIINARCGIGTASPQITQFTHNCEAIKFVVDKDFSNYAVVVITSIEGKVSAVTEGEALVKTYSDNNRETTLLWYPQSEITAQSGCVIYQIAAYSTDDEKKPIWYSKEGRLIVSDSIDTSDLSTELIGSSPSLVMQILTLAKATEVNLAKAVDDIEANKKKISANEENIALNVGNISALGEDYTSYKNEVHKGEEKYNPQSILAQSGKAVAEAIAAIVNSAPDTLNTLEELAAALGDDPNFATTIMTLLGGKVDKVEGKGLSSNDYTDTERTMVSNADTMVMEHDDKIRVMNDSLAELDINTGLLGDELTTHASDMSNPHFVTKEQIGLESVDNTSDMDKPISTAVQEALDTKADMMAVDDKIASYDTVLMNINADTQLAVNTAMNNKNSIEELELGKVDKVEGKGLSTNDFTDDDKSNLETLRGDMDHFIMFTTDLDTQIHKNMDAIIALNPTPITTIPTTLESNKKYNFGELTELNLAFPTVANDGDVIYLTFKSGATATALTIDTTNTCDIEVIPEVNTGYEIFGSFNGSIWIVGYSEYTVSEG